MLQSTIPVLLCTTKYYSSTSLYYKVLFQYYFVLLCTTKYYSSTTLYYKVLLQYYPVLEVLLHYYSVLQSATPVLLQYRKSFQNDRFVRGFLKISQKKLPKRAFRAKLPTEEGSKMIVSCEASSKFHKRSFQNDRFVRGFFKISQKKLTMFTEEGSKMIVSCEASSKFHKRRFQNERFARGFFKISHKKLPKSSFRARLRNFTEQASKMIVSCEASSKFHRKSFQNERFVRSFLQILQKKVPK